jgi:hypothetical protein
MISNAALATILETATDLTVVAEVYSSDAAPTVNGFDPADAIDCFASVLGVSYRGRTYNQLVTNIGGIKRSIDDEVNTASITFSNMSREISDFEFNGGGFEGLILVIRLVSWSLSVELDESQILFAGRCEKPKSGKRDSLQVTAKFILDSQMVTIPRRKFGPQDYAGREPTDPEFEGFRFMPKEGNLTYSIRKKRGGLLGLFGIKKTVKATLHYSTYSALDANRSLPEVFGFAQIVGTPLGWFDAGTHLQIRTAFCEGEIEDFINTRSVDSTLPLDSVAFAKQYGLVGAANGDDPAWVAPGYYSRTALIRGQIDNSSMDVTDPAPDVVSIIKGRLLPTPDDGGVWGSPVWTENGAAVVRYLLTGGDYYDLDENWTDNDTFVEAYNHNAETILDPYRSDFLFLT